jgi:uncharacterized HhH-GPD family protein
MRHEGVFAPRCRDYGGAMPTELHYTADADANRLLAEDPLALLIGLVLYQQVPIEKAFSGPLVLRERLGGTLDAAEIAAMSPEALDEAFRERPALHRFPGNMAKRTHAVCAYLVDEYGGDVTALWRDIDDADELMKRLQSLPGFGEYKARVYLGVLAERFDVRPDGWQRHLPDWPSIVDITRPEDLAEVKDRKKAWKGTAEH